MLDFASGGLVPTGNRGDSQVQTRVIILKPYSRGACSTGDGAVIIVPNEVPKLSK